jgi:hypothetical protein
MLIRYVLTLGRHLTPEKPTMMTSDKPGVTAWTNAVFRWYHHNMAVISQRGHTYRGAINTNVHTSVQKITHHANLFTRKPPPRS